MTEILKSLCIYIALIILMRIVSIDDTPNTFDSENSAAGMLYKIGANKLKIHLLATNK